MRCYAKPLSSSDKEVVGIYSSTAGEMGERVVGEMGNGTEPLVESRLVVVEMDTCRALVVVEEMGNGKEPLVESRLVVVEMGTCRAS